MERRIEERRQLHTAPPGRLWRDEAGRRNVSQAQMARLTGYSQKHINAVFQGRTEPSVQLVIKMALVLRPEDPLVAQQLARNMFTMQCHHKLRQAISELRGWTPLPDWQHRPTPKE